MTPPWAGVVLRGLDIEGLGTGLAGIKVLGGLQALHVENCTINNFRGANGSGIEINPTSPGTTQVYVKDTIIRRNGQGAGGGVFIHPGADVTVKAHLDNVQLLNNTFGLKVSGGIANTTVMASDTVAAGNAGDGFAADGLTSQLTIEDSVASLNSRGVHASGGGIIRIGGMTIVNNSANGILAEPESFVFSFKDNELAGNNPDGKPTKKISKK